jgi:hypothetical protein
MSAHCSAALADSTTASAGLGFDTRSSVSRILGGEGCLGSGGLESPSTTTYELWVAQKGFEGKFQTDRYTTPSLVTGGTKQGEVPLLFSAAASPAKTSQLPDAVPDSKPANDPAFSSSSCGSPMSLFNPEGMSSLRTYPDYFPAKADEISLSYSRRWPSSGFTTSPGECWTADTSESPNDGAESSSLADVLQADVPAKYFLSPKAAAGILRRAEKRGRELPTHLSAALEAVARTTTTDKPAA